MRVLKTMDASTIFLWGKEGIVTARLLLSPVFTASLFLQKLHQSWFHGFGPGGVAAFIQV